MSNFYGTEFEIWAGFGPVGSTEKKNKPQCMLLLRESPFTFRTQLRDPHFFQNCGHFQYHINWHQNKVSWCYIENDHNFERNEDHIFRQSYDLDPFFLIWVPFFIAYFFSVSKDGCHDAGDYDDTALLLCLE